MVAWSICLPDDVWQRYWTSTWSIMASHLLPSYVFFSLMSIVYQKSLCSVVTKRNWSGSRSLWKRGRERLHLLGSHHRALLSSVQGVAIQRAAEEDLCVGERSKLPTPTCPSALQAEPLHQSHPRDRCGVYDGDGSEGWGSTCALAWAWRSWKFIQRGILSSLTNPSCDPWTRLAGSSLNPSRGTLCGHTVYQSWVWWSTSFSCHLLHLWDSTCLFSNLGDGFVGGVDGWEEDINSWMVDDWMSSFFFFFDFWKPKSGMVRSKINWRSNQMAFSTPLPCQWFLFCLTFKSHVPVIWYQKNDDGFDDMT